MHLLLSEDNAPVGEALQHLLRHTGFVVDWSWLRDCEAFAESGAYDLVILDYGAEPARGIALLQKLRHADDAVAIVAFGAYGGGENSARLLEAGAAGAAGGAVAVSAALVTGVSADHCDGSHFCVTKVTYSCGPCGYGCNPSWIRPHMKRVEGENCYTKEKCPTKVYHAGCRCKGDPCPGQP